ncbi:MFS transporter [Kineococcus sp. SYSU DK006]|uniref:MFS transporter n=1 Tax=Kineococcus sp. SYSU DK006 TaxID=3383127 RepID=UPI003D7D6E09
MRPTPRPPLPPLLLLTAALFAAVTTEVLPVGLLPQLAQAFAVDQSRIGWWVSAYAVVVAAGAIPVTAWLARWPRRPVLVALLVGYALSNAAIVLAPGYGWALAARLLGGLAHAGIFSVVVATTVELVARERSGRALALVNSGVTLALTAGVPLGTALGAALGWRWAFATTSLLLLVLAAAVAALLPPGRPAAPADRPPSVRQALRGRALLAVALTTTLVTLGHYTAYTYVTPIVLAAGVPTGSVSLVLFAYGLASLVGLALTARLADRGGSAVLRCGVALAVACLLALVLVDGVVATVGVVALWGAAFGALPTLLQTAALRASGGSDAAPALVNATFNVGIAAGAWAGGLLLGADVRAPALAGALLAGLGLLSTLALRPAAGALPRQRAARASGLDDHPDRAGAHVVDPAADGHRRR